MDGGLDLNSGMQSRSLCILLRCDALCALAPEEQGSGLRNAFPFILHSLRAPLACFTFEAKMYNRRCWWRPPKQKKALGRHIGYTGSWREKVCARGGSLALGFRSLGGFENPRSIVAEITRVSVEAPLRGGPDESSKHR